MGDCAEPRQFAQVLDITSVTRLQQKAGDIVNRIRVGALTSFQYISNVNPALALTLEFNRSKAFE